MIKYLKRNTYFIFPIVVCLWFYSLTKQQFLSLFDSDYVFGYLFSKSMLIEHASIKTWDLGTCTFLFPNIFIYAFLFILTKKVVVTHLIFGVIQITGLAYLLRKIGSTIFEEISNTSLLLIDLGLVLFFIQPNVLYTKQLFVPIHTGVFIIGVLSLLFVFLYYKTNRSKYLILVAILSLLSVVSDKMYLEFFTLPGCSISVVLILNKKRKGLVILLYVFTSAILGELLYRLFIYKHWFAMTELPLHLSLSWEALHTYISILKKSLQGNWLMLFFFLFSMIIWIIECIRLVRVGLVSRLTNIRDLFGIYYLSFFGITMLSPIMFNVFFSVESIRYICFAPFISLVFIPFYIQYFISKNPIYKYAIIFTYSFVLLCFIIYCLRNIQLKPLDYRPDNVTFIDGMVSKYSLKNGVAGYWNSNYYNAFTHSLTSIHATSEQLNTYELLCDKRKFYVNTQSIKTLYTFLYPTLYFKNAFIKAFFADDLHLISNGKDSLFKTSEFYFDIATGVVMKSVWKPVKQITFDFESNVRNGVIYSKADSLTVGNAVIQSISHSGKSCLNLSDIEYGPTVLTDTLHLGETILYSCWIYPAKTDSIILVADNKKDWRSMSVIDTIDSRGWGRMVFKLNVREQYAGTRFNLLLWNFKKEHFKVDDIELTVVK